VETLFRLDKKVSITNGGKFIQNTMY